MPNAQYEEISEVVLKTSGAKRAYILENHAHKKPKVASIGPKIVCGATHSGTSSARSVWKWPLFPLPLHPPFIISSAYPSPFLSFDDLEIDDSEVYEDVHGQTPEIPATPPSPPRISFPAAAQSSLSVSPDSMEVEDEELEDVKDCTPTLVPTSPLLTPSPGPPRYLPPAHFRRSRIA
ncbi:hypothetical protein B0H17DRAFT_1203689 [Mycena rosella]|uniref:Uncharacterized protein n=1 Tax=Mycena rosella TaxID=1033263 RepID=A0AAD7GC46_MYCRO|nr:hypothetical protein B0H17DRAFT_1203689 [Mycena rosella]